MVSMLSEDKVEALCREGAVVLDTRSQEAYAQGHIPGSLFLSVGRTFPMHLSAVLSPSSKVIIFTAGALKETVEVLVSLGCSLLGYIEEWKGARAKSREIQVEMLETSSVYHIVDVRTPEEWRSGHIQGAQHIPLSELRNYPLKFSKEVALVCGSGYRSLVGCSLLESKGMTPTNVVGGMMAWTQEGLPLVH